MPAKQVSEIGGKVLQSAVRTGERPQGGTYAFAWVQLLDRKLNEIVEVTCDISDGKVNPFIDLQRGQYVTYPVGALRLFGSMLTGSLVVDEPAGELDPDVIPF